MPVLANLRFLTLAALPLFGQTLETPRTASIFHAASHSVRPIIGMTGASHLGPASYSDLDFASIAPDQRNAILVAGNQTRLTRNIQNADAIAIENAISFVDRILWSSDSGTAILFSSVNRQLQWLVDGQLSAVTNLPENALLLTAAHDGRTAITTANGRIYRITSDTAPVQIALLTNPIAATFDSEGLTLYLADSTTNEIVELRDTGNSYTQRTFLSAADGIEDPVALRLTPDNAAIYVAMKASRAISSYRTLDKALLMRLPLDWTPSSFESLSPETFLLNPAAPIGEPLSVLMTRNGLAEFFIPAGDAK